MTSWDDCRQISLGEDNIDKIRFIQPQYPYDAVIVGSGATGGWAAKLLTEAGLSVVLLEAGPLTTPHDFGTDWSNSLKSSPSLKTLARSPIQAGCYACRPPLDKWFVDDNQQQYTAIKPYSWIRMRALAGRLLAWEGQSYRMSDLDFKACSWDGHGQDWPISYQTLEPHYQRLESYLEVCGQREGLPHLPDGNFLSGLPANYAINRLGPYLRQSLKIHITPARLSRLTRHSVVAQSLTNITLNECKLNIATPWKALHDAMATGRLRIVPDAVASNVLIEKQLVRGVTYIDAKTQEKREVLSTFVLMCASTLESTRILLHSGIGRQSPALGRYLMDHIFGAEAKGSFELHRNALVSNSAGQNNKFYIPRFRNLPKQSPSKFIRGYGIQGRYSLSRGSHAVLSKSSNISKHVRVIVRLTAYGECVADPANHVSLNKHAKDPYGIPTLKIQAGWSSNELAMMNDAQGITTDILANAKLSKIGSLNTVSIPGLCVHESGTARMGNDPYSSVVTPYCETHQIANLFVTDGACWVSNGCQNPTLTMMSITSHACTEVIRRYHSYTKPDRPF